MNSCIVHVGQVRRVRILRIYNLCQTQELSESGSEDYVEKHNWLYSRGQVRRVRILHLVT